MAAIYMQHTEVSANRTVGEITQFLSASGASLVGNTEESDLTWFARNLYERCADFGMGDVAIPADWSIRNETFEATGLRPRRYWAGDLRFDDLTEAERTQWISLARACMSVLPRICQRIGHRMMNYAKAMNSVDAAEWVAVRRNRTAHS